MISRLKFGQAISDGTSVAIIFGNGVNALIGEIAGVYDDYFIVTKRHPNVEGRLEEYHVPYSAIQYVRIDS